MLQSGCKGKGAESAPKRKKEEGEERWASEEDEVQIEWAGLSEAAMKIEQELVKMERGKKVEHSGSVDEERN